MKEIKAPNRFNQFRKPMVFLAGSIEMGKAENWQTKIVKNLAAEDVVILNPRRDDWDSNWEQSIKNKKFRQQVEWELKAQEEADIIAMYIDPQTKSPITLLELGLFAKSRKLIVCCPDGFWRKGNVDVVCKRYQIAQALTLDDLCQAIVRQLHLFDGDGCGSLPCCP